MSFGLRVKNLIESEETNMYQHILGGFQAVA